MKRLFGAIAVASLLLCAPSACRQVAGIHPITYTGAEGGGGGCTNGTLVISTSDDLDTLAAASGFVLAGVVGNTGTDVNLVACGVGSTCMQPASLLSLAFNDQFQSFAASSKIFYTLQQGAAGTGSIHSVGFDGTGDAVLAGSLANPLWITVTGTRTFWVNDDLSGTADVHCLGCGASDMMWISNIASTYGIFSDANNVYAIADDGSVNATNAVYACSINTACGTSPRLVIKGLDSSSFTPAVEMAADGTSFYVTNDASAILRVGPTGTQTTVVSGVAAAAIAVDPVTGELFYGANDGTVARAKADGSAAPTPMSACGASANIIGLTFDATNVYVLLSDPNTLVSSVYAIKR